METSTEGPASTASPDDQGALPYMIRNVWPLVLVALGSVSVIVFVAYLILHMRHHRRYDYTVLNEDLERPRVIDRAKKREKEEIRDVALLNCSFYLRTSGRYTLIDQLPTLGRRDDKHWFWLRENKGRKDYMLTMFPKATTDTDHSAQNSMNNFVHFVKHPYIVPVSSIDSTALQTAAAVITPYCREGSLKDVIHGKTFSEGYLDKYLFRGKRLAVSQIQIYGKQILEALVYLSDLGFPPFCHLHSGNILVEDFVCRLSGIESTLLNEDFKLQHVFRKRIRDHFKRIDSLCFGHLLFEMACGYELDSSHPKATHMADIADAGLAEVLHFVFDGQNKYPTILEIYQHAFFQGVHLREMEDFNESIMRVPSEIKILLRGVRRKQKAKYRYTMDPSDRRRSRSSVVEVELQPTQTVYDGGDNITFPKIPLGLKDDLKKSSFVSKPSPDLAAVHSPPPSLPAERSHLLADIRKGMTLRKSFTGNLF